MSRLVTHRLTAPEDFSRQVAGLVSAEDIDAQQRDLRRLAEFEMDYSQTIQFHHALNRLPAASLEGLRCCRLASLQAYVSEAWSPLLAFQPHQSLERPPPNELRPGANEVRSRGYASPARMGFAQPDLFTPFGDG